jgi:hypothetical protein
VLSNEVGHVAVLGEAREFNDSDASGEPMQVPSDILGVLSAGLIIVRQYVDCLPFQRFGRIAILADALPLTSTLWIGGRHDTEALQVNDVLLAFRNPDLVRTSNLRQTENDFFETVKVVYPLPRKVRMRASLAESLVLAGANAANLVE